MKSVTNNNILFLRFLMPYLLILFIPLSTNFYINEKTVDLLKSEAYQASIRQLVQARETMDQRIIEMDSMLHSIKSNPNVLRFQYNNGPIGNRNVLDILALREELDPYAQINRFVSRFFVFYKESEIVLNNAITYTFKDFYEHYFQYEGLEYDEWYDLFFGQYHNKTIFESDTVSQTHPTRSTVTYLESLGNKTNNRVVIALMIDSDNLVERLKGIDIAGGGWAYIADGKGNIISSIGSDSSVRPRTIETGSGEGSMEQTIDSHDMIVTYTHAQNGWSYVAAQPKEMVLSKVSYIKKITIHIVFASLLVGLLSAYFMAYRNSRPLKRLLRHIYNHFQEDVNAKRDAYVFIQDTIDRLKDRNQEFETRIEEQLPLVQGAFFERLLHGEATTGMLSDNNLTRLNIRLKGRYYAVAVLKLQRYDSSLTGDVLEELPIIKILVKDALLRFATQGIYVHDLSDDRQAIIFTFAENQGHADQIVDQVDTVVQRAVGEIAKQRNMVVGIGHAYESLTELSRSFMEAEEAVQFGVKQNTIFQRYDGLPSASSGYYYPPAIETALYNNIKAGDLSGVQKLVDAVFEENFIKRHLSLPLQRLLVFEWIGSIVKLLQQIDYEQSDALCQHMYEQMNRIDSYAQTEKLFMQITAHCLSIAQSIHSKKRSHNDKLIHELIQFIHDRYSDPNLCLALVAAHFHISEVYVSHILKEQTGINFSDHMEGIRMEYSRKLLKTTELAVNDVAAQVGYASANTFSRAFKRMHGVSASVFRVNS